MKEINFSALPFNTNDVPFIPDKKPVTNVGLYVQYGKGNDYPDFLNNLYQNSPILSSIINAVNDYVLGDNIQFSDFIKSKLTYNSEHELFNLIRRIVFDKIVTGAFAIKLIYNLNKECCKIEWVDIRNLRVSLDERTIYWSQTWTQGRRGELVAYTNFNNFTPGADENNPYQCIYYDKGRSRGIYGAPYWQGAIRSIESEIEINKFHLHSIQHGLSSSAIVNIPNGESYTDEEKKIIEKKFRDNFCGSDNSDGFILSFNPDPESKVEIVRIADAQFDKKFEVLSKSTIKSIFTAFRMAPNLAGYLMDNIGFNNQEFSESFNIFNITVIKPMQKDIISSLDNLFNTRDSIIIEPFKINLNNTL